MGSDPVYFDYAASTPVDERVLADMLPYFSARFGNPSSIHRFGQLAEAALEDSRERIAEAFHCEPDEVIFTSGGTESDNLAVRGAARSERARRGRSHILTTPVEHPAVLNACRQLANLEGFEIELLPVDSHGRVDPAAVKASLRPDTALVSIIHANNEIGTVNPISAIASVCRDHQVLLHTDSVQAAAHLPLDFLEMGADLVSIGGHKLYGPKGVGALLCRRGLDLWPVQRGGGQEEGRRAGTENVPSIVGLARAIQLVREEQPFQAPRLRDLRDRIFQSVTHIPGARPTGDPENRLPNHASFVFDGIEANRLLAALDLAGFACSSGSACKTGTPEPSAVLLAVGVPPALALGSLRITLGRPTTAAEVDSLLATLPKVIASLRERATVAL